MATNREPLGTSFDTRLWLSGGRNGMPVGTMRRAVAVAPELTGSAMSRWGTLNLYPVNAVSVYKWNGHRYAYDGSTLFQDNVPIKTGFTGGKLNFVEAPPQVGEQDYLFVQGGGQLFKIAPDGTITNWGIAAPGIGGSVAVPGSDLNIIEPMTSNLTGQWTHNGNCTLAFDNTADDPFLPGGCYKITMTGAGAPWFITKTYSTPQDFSILFGGVFSLQSDLVSIYAQFAHPENTVWMWLMFDVNDGTFQKDYYKLVVQLVATTNAVHAAGASVILLPSPGQWIQVAGTKNQFQRVGSNLNLDWSHVIAVRIEGGDPSLKPAQVLLNGLQIIGGYPLGQGPAALTGGSTYQYLVTFGNTVTNSDSNPNGMDNQPDGTVSQPVPIVANGVALNPNFVLNIPTSTDPQVNMRKLWRTTAGGAEFFYLDTIPDNTTVSYMDVTGDIPGQPVIVTPWTKNVAITHSGPIYKVDGGNGFWFYTAGGGTTGANLPNWNIPPGPFLGDWVPWITYGVGNWVNYLGRGYVCLRQNRNVTPTSSLGTNWQAIGTTTDNTVTWTWGGLNAVRTLGTQGLLLDNQPPQLTYGDVTGPWEGSLFWTRDSRPGGQGWVYASPPGRPESVGTSFTVSSGEVNATMQKVIIWDQLPWALATNAIYIIQGSYPAFSPTVLKGALGTEFPYTVVAAQNGVYYRGTDGIRVFNRSGSELAGFQNIAPIERGRTVENVGPFRPVWGAIARSEVFFGDNVVTFALGIEAPKDLISFANFVWRMLGRPLLCAFYERDDDSVLASFGGYTVLYEEPGVPSDGIPAAGFPSTQFDNVHVPPVVLPFTSSPYNAVLSPNAYAVMTVLVVPFSASPYSAP